MMYKISEIDKETIEAALDSGRRVEIIPINDGVTHGLVMRAIRCLPEEIAVYRDKSLLETLTRLKESIKR